MINLGTIAATAQTEMIPKFFLFRYERFLMNRTNAFFFNFCSCAYLQSAELKITSF